MTRYATLLVALCGLLALPGRALAALPGNPFADGPSFVDTKFNPALDAQRALFRHGHGREARLLNTIVQTPHARYWPIRQSGRDLNGVLDRVDRTTNDRAIPILATENLPTIGCAKNPVPLTSASFKRWVDSFAHGFHSHKAIVVVETDGIGTSTCLRGGALRKRIGLIAYEVRALTKNPNVSVYLDAGASDWSIAGHKPMSSANLSTIARLLRMAGIKRARGFALNATHFDWTANNIRFGTRLSRMLGGAHFIINTSRNGRGPLKGGRRHGNIWCNPAGRGLGPFPTTHTGNRLVDAFYWNGSPGTSNGRCGKERGSLVGPARVGTFWVPYALAFIRNGERSPDFPQYRRAR